MIDKFETVGYFVLMSVAGILVFYDQVVTAGCVFMIAIWIEYTTRKKGKEATS